MFHGASAQAAEAAGVDTVFVMDHFYQLPGLGPPDNAMLESYTILSTVAAVTESVRLGALVTAFTYRNPTLPAKEVTTLDIVSGGRALLGLGAGWYQLEHDSLGYEFGTFTDRFEKLEEALQIIKPMLADERPTFDGKHYQVRRPSISPADPGSTPHRPLPAEAGMSYDERPEQVQRQISERLMLGDPDTVAEMVQTKAGRPRATGTDLRSPCDVARPRIGLTVGRTLEPLFA